LDGVYIDNLFVFFALVYYISLIVVYLLRAHELGELELKMGPWFSIQLIPFSLLWVVILLFYDFGRLITGLPIIIFLIYDFWYRWLTRKKPVHHPDRWPVGLVVYVVLLFIGCIGLNWYGFLVSDFYGNVLVVGFFLMMISFGYYQYRYRKGKQSREEQIT